MSRISPPGDRTFISRAISRPSADVRKNSTWKNRSFRPKAATALRPASSRSAGSSRRVCRKLSSLRLTSSIIPSEYLRDEQKTMRPSLSVRPSKVKMLPWMNSSMNMSTGGLSAKNFSNPARSSIFQVPVAPTPLSGLTTTGYPTSETIASPSSRSWKTFPRATGIPAPAKTRFMPDLLRMGTRSSGFSPGMPNSSLRRASLSSQYSLWDSRRSTGPNRSRKAVTAAATWS